MRRDSRRAKQAMPEDFQADSHLIYPAVTSEGVSQSGSVKSSQI